MEMDNNLYKGIVKLTNEGEMFLKRDKPEKAKEKFLKALELVPEPKTDWETSTWIYTALGDIEFYNNHFEESMNFFLDALNCPDSTNPYIYLKLGESLFELNNFEKAKEYLLRAYMLDGDEIFRFENPKYFELIQDII